MKKLTVGLGARSYDILIGRGVLAQAKEYITSVCPKAERFAIVSDETVKPLYADPVRRQLQPKGEGWATAVAVQTVGGGTPELVTSDMMSEEVKRYHTTGVTLPVGEESKSVRWLEQVYNGLSGAGFRRSDCLVAVGGGVVGDLTGFAAATYMRGVDFVQVPTTLLAMVDSSVGGKTGINLPAGKNLVGAFWQPKLVLVDINCLDTLPDRDFFSGMAEVLKYAYLSEFDLHKILNDCGGDRRKLMEHMEEIIEICCRIKTEIVAEDERDTGARMVLNLGHTLGHAYEKAGGFQKYTHGEAIAAGMVMAARLSAQFGFCDRALTEDVRHMVAMHHLPTVIPALDDDYAEAIGLDKKGEGADTNFIFLEGIGKPLCRKLLTSQLLGAVSALKPDPLTLRITPARLAGEITPPGSKSIGHRLLIASALADGGSIQNLTESQDIDATDRCMRVIRLGQRAEQVLDCGESGSTLRFLIPIALALNGEGRFTGGGKLMERPQEPYFELFRERGIDYDLTDGFLTVKGTLPPGIYRLAGNVSSQFITGLLFALPLLNGDSEIMLTTKLESKSYVDMTLEALRLHGIQVEERENGYRVPGNQQYVSTHTTVEPDYSQSGFFYAAEFLGNLIKVSGMRPDSAQGDRVILDYVNRMKRSGELTLDVSDCPDLVPPLAVAAALRTGERTILANAARLRIKESDRLATTTSELCKLGAQIAELPESLVIDGVAVLHGGEVESHNDHRIAMMLAVAATRCDGDVILHGAEAVNKSYPRFWKDYVNLGGVTFP